jgi:hypothetical protein
VKKSGGFFLWFAGALVFGGIQYRCSLPPSLNIVCGTVFGLCCAGIVFSFIGLAGKE